MRRLRFVIELVVALVLVVPARLLRLVRSPRPSVVITGWYGSETIGDIAILGQVIREIRAVRLDAAIRVATFDSPHTVRSLLDLGEPSVASIPVGAASAWRQSFSTALVYGGGPLMESPSMMVWAARALLARAAGTKVIVYGCGIGPVRTTGVQRSIGLLLRTADLVVLRDSESLAHLPEAFGPGPLVTFDPAFDLVRRYRHPHVQEAVRRVAVVLRMPPRSYLDLVEGERQTWAESFLGVVASTLDILVADGVSLEGLIMYEQDDENDRDVLVAVRSRMKDREAVHVDPGRHSLEHVIDVVNSADVVFSVRFHGLVFGLALDRSVVAIDYARPRGKVGAAAAEAGLPECVIPVDSIDPRELANCILDATTRPAPAVRSAILDSSRQRTDALRSVIGADM